MILSLFSKQCPLLICFQRNHHGVQVSSSLTGRGWRGLSWTPTIEYQCVKEAPDESKRKHKERMKMPLGKESFLSRTCAHMEQWLSSDTCEQSRTAHGLTQVLKEKKNIPHFRKWPQKISVFKTNDNIYSINFSALLETSCFLCQDLASHLFSYHQNTLKYDNTLNISVQF